MLVHREHLLLEEAPYVCLGLERMTPSSETMPTPILLAEPSMPRTSMLYLTEHAYNKYSFNVWSQSHVKLQLRQVIMSSCVMKVAQSTTFDGILTLLCDARSTVLLGKTADLRCSDSSLWWE